MSALPLARQAARLRLVQDAAARAIAAHAYERALTRAQLFETTPKHPEYFWAHAVGQAWERSGYLRAAGTNGKAGVLYVVADVRPFKTIVEDESAAAVWIATPKPSRQSAPEPSPDDDDDAELSEIGAEASWETPGEAAAASPADPVVEAIVGALERTVSHVVAIGEKLDRDSRERDVQTDLLLSLGEKLEGGASRSDVAEAGATVAAELVGALARESAKPEIESLAIALAERVAEDRAWRAGVDARLDAFERAVFARLDTQAEKVERGVSAIGVSLRAAIDERLPSIETLPRIATEIHDSFLAVEASAERATKLIESLVKAIASVGLDLRANSEVSKAAAESLASVLRAAAGAPAVKRALEKAADRIDGAIVLHEMTDGRETATTKIEPKPDAPRLRSTRSSSVALGMAAGLGMSDPDAGAAYVESAEKKP